MMYHYIEKNTRKKVQFAFVDETVNMQITPKNKNVTCFASSRTGIKKINELLFKVKCMRKNSFGWESIGAEWMIGLDGIRWDWSELN